GGDRRIRAVPAQAEGRGRRGGRRRRGRGLDRRQDGQGHGRRDGGAEGQVCGPDGLRQGVGGGEEGAGRLISAVSAFSANPLGRETKGWTARAEAVPLGFEIGSTMHRAT